MALNRALADIDEELARRLATLFARELSDVSTIYVGPCAGGDELFPRIFNLARDPKGPRFDLSLKASAVDPSKAATLVTPKDAYVRGHGTTGLCAGFSLTPLGFHSRSCRCRGISPFAPAVVVRRRFAEVSATALAARQAAVLVATMPKRLSPGANV